MDVPTVSGLDTPTVVGGETATVTGKQRKKKEMGELNKDILTLVSRGSAIIAEILRLKDYIPETYANPNPQDEKLYGNIIFDFQYFVKNNQEKFDRKIVADSKLRDLDEDFRENNIEIDFLVIHNIFLIFLYSYSSSDFTFLDADANRRSASFMYLLSGNSFLNP